MSRERESKEAPLTPAELAQSDLRRRWFSELSSQDRQGEVVVSFLSTADSFRNQMLSLVILQP